MTTSQERLQSLLREATRIHIESAMHLELGVFLEETAGGTPSRDWTAGLPMPARTAVDLIPADLKNGLIPFLNQELVTASSGVRDMGAGAAQRLTMWRVGLGTGLLWCQRQDSLPPEVRAIVENSIWLAVMGGVAQVHASCGDLLRMEDTVRAMHDRYAFSQSWVLITDPSVAALDHYTIAQVRIGNLAEAQRSATLYESWMTTPAAITIDNLNLDQRFIRSDQLGQRLLTVADTGPANRALVLAEVVGDLAHELSTANERGSFEEAVKKIESTLLTPFDLQPDDAQTLAPAGLVLAEAVPKAGDRVAHLGIWQADLQRAGLCRMFGLLWWLLGRPMKAKNPEAEMAHLREIEDGATWAFGHLNHIDADEPDAPQEILVTRSFVFLLRAMYWDRAAHRARILRWAHVQRLETKAAWSFAEAAALSRRLVAQEPRELLVLRLSNAVRNKTVTPLGDDLDQVLEWIQNPHRRLCLGMPIWMYPKLEQLLIEYFISQERYEEAWRVFEIAQESSVDDFTMGYFRRREPTVATQRIVESKQRLATAKYQAAVLCPLDLQHQVEVTGGNGPDDLIMRLERGRSVIGSLADGRPPSRPGADSSLLLAVARGVDHVLLTVRCNPTRYRAVPCSPGRWSQICSGAAEGGKHLADWLGWLVTTAPLGDGDAVAPCRISVPPELCGLLTSETPAGRGGKKLDDLGPWSIDPLFPITTHEQPAEIFWAGVISELDPPARAVAEVSAAHTFARTVSPSNCTIVTLPPTFAADDIPWGSAQILHIACHGAIREGNPLFSEWEFGPGVALAVGDLATFTSSAGPITILSNCVGADIGASGIGLATGALIAGARAVVAFRGDMPEEAAVFMVMLSRLIAQGNDVATAAWQLRHNFPQLKDLLVFGDPTARATT